MKTNVTWELSSERQRGFVGLIAGTATQAVDRFGKFQNLKSQEYLSTLNAATLEGNAKLVDAQIRISEKEHKFTEGQATKEGEKGKSRQLAAFGKANVSGASVDAAQDEAARNIKLEALAIRYAGEVEKTRLVGEKAKFREAASQSRLAAASARKAQWMTDPSTSLISTFN